MISLLIFLVSLTVLLVASDKFVDKAEKIGLAMGISPFVVGVTIVAVGTSLPELATSVASIFNGTSEVVIANVVGSNITNILLVIGATAVVGKGITLDYDVMKSDMTKLVASAFLLYFVMQDGVLARFEAAILVGALVFFVVNSLTQEKEENLDRPKLNAVDLLVLVIASVLIIFAAKYTITGLVGIAEGLGIPPYIIAITAIALGTSLPEVVVSVTAARKGQHAIAVGNVIGSNIFNTYAVTGICGLLSNLAIPQDSIDVNMPFLIAITLLFAFSCISRKITKYEGWLFLLLYVYFIYQIVEMGV